MLKVDDDGGQGWAYQLEIEHQLWELIKIKEERNICLTEIEEIKDGDARN